MGTPQRSVAAGRLPAGSSPRHPLVVDPPELLQLRVQPLRCTTEDTRLRRVPQLGNEYTKHSVALVLLAKFP